VRTIFAEYIWIDGTKPTAKLRSKTKVIPAFEVEGGLPSPRRFPDWNFDGSSTNQAPGDRSDCVLKPVAVVVDPVRSGQGRPQTFSMEGVSFTVAPDHYLVLCEVFESDGETPHESNARAKLREVLRVPLDSHIEPFDMADPGTPEEMLTCWFGLEQEYTLFKGDRPAGFPQGGYPAAQGPYYCGVGADEVTGRPLVEAHLVACADAGLKISGINAEVMPGQWEFQIGPAGPLEAGDHLWLARWLLYRIGEDFEISATLNPKPVKGDWNGAGMHTNFSTPAMRAEGGMEVIEAWCSRAAKHVEGHLAAYGDDYQARLTGAHETASYRDFSWGVSDRTASVRIPLATKLEGCGYLEDRRPNANADPYEVAAVMMRTAYDLWEV